jgi:putative ATP-dependent endonuclease of OLD family
MPSDPMRLELFSVQNFRSIKKAEKLPLGEFTVLLGPNNEGKSNILQAMVLGMQELSQARAIRPRTSSRLRRRAGRTVGGYDWGARLPTFPAADSAGREDHHALRLPTNGGRSG